MVAAFVEIPETATMRRFALLIAAVIVVSQLAEAANPLAIGSRLEPFIDRYLVESFTGNAELVMHRPKPG